MAGPWEDYQSTQKEEAGPWQDFAKSGTGPRSEERGRHSATGREAKPVSKTAQVADLIEGSAKYASGGLLPAAVLAPEATAISAAGAAVGNYLGKKGAKAVGGGEDAQRLTGDVAGLVGGAASPKASEWLGGFAKELAGRASAAYHGLDDVQTTHIDRPIVPHEAYKPNPRVIKTPYGGPVDEYSGTPGKRVGMGGAPEPPPKPQPTPKEPWKAWKPNPRVIKTPYGGSTDETGGAPGRRIGMTGPKPEKGNPIPSPKAKASLPEPKTGANASGKATPGKPPVEQSEAAEALQAKTLGKVLRQAKIRPDDAAHIKPEEWPMVAKQANVNAPSEKVVRMALEENRKLWASSQADLQARRAEHFSKNHQKQ